MKTTIKMLLLSLVIFTALTGCRFGNYTEKEKTVSITQWNLGTTMHSFETYVFYNDTDSSGNQNYDANTNTPFLGVPSKISETFSNPVQLFFYSDFSGAAFYNQAGTSDFGTLNDASNNIKVNLKSDTAYLWKNTSCLTKAYLDQIGSIDRSKTESYTKSNGQSAKTDGRLKLSFSYNRVFEGDCLADLKELATCYVNPNTSGCTAAAANLGYELFDIHAYYGGILNFDDATLSRLRSLAYIVRFE